MDLINIEDLQLVNLYLYLCVLLQRRYLAYINVYLMSIEDWIVIKNKRTNLDKILIIIFQ